MRLIIIAALSENRVIGKNGKVPWNIPEDMQRFKRLTLHHTVLMGRRSYETLEEPLVHRRNVVLTSKKIPGVETYTSLESALNNLRNQEIVWIIGGGEIFTQTLDMVDEWKLTHVQQQIEGDTFFPEYKHLINSLFSISFEEHHDGFIYRDYVKHN